MSKQLGCTDLLEACYAPNENPTRVYNLIREGVDLNCTNIAGYTPLMLAVSNEKLEGIVPSLIVYGADLNKVDNINGWTALMHACKKLRFKEVELLINRGALKNIMEPVKLVGIMGRKTALDLLNESLNSNLISDMSKNKLLRHIIQVVLDQPLENTEVDELMKNEEDKQKLHSITKIIRGSITQNTTMKEVDKLVEDEMKVGDWRGILLKLQRAMLEEGESLRNFMKDNGCKTGKEIMEEKKVKINPFRGGNRKRKTQRMRKARKGTRRSKV